MNEKKMKLKYTITKPIYYFSSAICGERKRERGPVANTLTHKHIDTHS